MLAIGVIPSPGTRRADAVRAIGRVFGTMRESQRELIDHTLQVWQPRTSRKLAPEDARQIVENMSGFLKILLEWQAAEEAREGGAARSGAKAGAE